MNFKALTRACIFSLSLSFLGFSSFEIKAVSNSASTQACTGAAGNFTNADSDYFRAAQIAHRMKTIIINLLSSGDIKHIAMAQTYLMSLNPTEPLVQKLLLKMKASWDELMEKLRATKRLRPSGIEAHLVAAFDKFGDDILAIAQEIRSRGNNAGLIELAVILEKIPQEVKQEFDALTRVQKTRFGTNIWMAKKL